MSHEVLAVIVLVVFSIYHVDRRERLRKRLEAVIDRMAERLIIEQDAAHAARAETLSLVTAVEPLLQKTAWSMGEIYQSRGQEVARNDLIDRVRRDLAKFNLPDATKGGSYEDLSHLNKYPRSGQLGPLEGSS